MRGALPRRPTASLPKPLFDALRNARTLALRVAEPLDAIHRHLTGRGHLPPLWLRRHVGPVAAYERSPGEIATTLVLLGIIRENSHVLDIGCGCGAMSFEFQRMLGSEGRYVGFDVHEPSIRWCQQKFRGDERFTFSVAQVASPYSTEFQAPAANYRFPAEDGSSDLILAKSLFTHLLEQEARQYLAEIRRTLAVGGHALITAFLLEEDGTPRKPEGALYEFPFGADGVRWMAAGRPVAGVGFVRSHFFAMLRIAGLRVQRIYEGYWAGNTIAPNAQDVLVLTIGNASHD